MFCCSLAAVKSCFHAGFSTKVQITNILVGGGEGVGVEENSRGYVARVGNYSAPVPNFPGTFNVRTELPTF